MDVLASQASSVPCERLFSGSKQTATDRRARLGNARFEELQMMKHSWKLSLIDIAAWNSGQVEEVDMQEFEEMLLSNEEEDKWAADDLQGDNDIIVDYV